MIGIGWIQREPPLAVAGVAVRGGSVSHYASLLADRIDSIDGLRVVAGDKHLVALSDSAVLSWVDGATWLGLDDGLLCPTHLAPNIPSSLVRKAVSRGHGSSGVVVATPDLAIVAPMPARAPSAAILRVLNRLAGPGTP